MAGNTVLFYSEPMAAAPPHECFVWLPRTILPRCCCFWLLIKFLCSYHHACACAHIICAHVCTVYRLAPEHPFPAAPDDCLATLSYITDPANAGRHRADPSRVAVAGDSAGGAWACIGNDYRYLDRRAGESRGRSDGEGEVKKTKR